MYNTEMNSLIDKILLGDSQGVIEFYREYSPQILRYLRHKLSREEDVQEILNDTFLEAIDSLALLKNKNSISSWLYSIAHHKIVDFYRKRKIKSILFSQAPFLEVLSEEMHQPEFVYEKNKIRNKIEKAYKSISKRYQEILTLHYEDKISVKELSFFFNLSFKATESLLFRARQRFRQAYERT